MKKYYLFYIVNIISLSISAQVGNVGIGTDNPQTALDVNGSMLIQGSTKPGTISNLASGDDNYYYLMRRPDSNPPGEVTYLDVSSLNIAPVNVVNYTFTGLSRDNLTNVNLQYPTSKYIVALANFRYDGYPISKQSFTVGTNSNHRSFGNFVTRVFEEGSTWHLEIRNRVLDLPAGQSVTYHVTLVVYDRSFFKQLNTIRVDMNGSENGQATTSPVP
ncbi:MAG TPA: hypothetical protein VFF21_03825 [Flavobacteriaceae bacterium]|nr:hypothetical protein [Flavobacteriaceae bacterium]